MTAGFTLTFGGNNILPSQPSHRAIALTENTQLAWPVEVAVDENVVAVIMDVTPAGAGLALWMPPADETTPGNGALIVNRGSFGFTVADALGNVIAAIAPGLGWQIWITDNSTPAGAWASVQYGAGVSSANSGALAGYGIRAIATTLNQSIPVTSLNADYTAGPPDRAALLNWTGGAGIITLPPAAGIGADWFIQVRNSGTGTVVATPSGLDNIDNGPWLNFNPGDSAVIVSDGVGYYSIGFGQAPAFAFSYISINLTGQTSPYVLSGGELNQIAYNFGGVLTANMEIVVPATVQQYWVRNTTTGAFILTVKTATGTGYTVAQGAAAILYSDGTNVVLADSAGIATPIAIVDGGTGATNATAALINLGGTAVGRAVFTAVDQAAAQAAIGTSGGGGGVSSVGGTGSVNGISLTGLVTSTGNLVLGGALSGIDLAAAVAGILPIASGGTAANTAAGARASLAALESTQNVFVSDIAGTGRFFFATAGTTYHVSPTGHAFRINGNGGSDAVLIDTSGNLTCSGDITAFSDERQKTNIHTIADALAKVENMRGVTFDRIEGGSSSGVIAQELEQVAPELVLTNEDGMMSVAYGNIVGYLIEAVKELSARIEALES